MVFLSKRLVGEMDQDITKSTTMKQKILRRQQDSLDSKLIDAPLVVHLDEDPLGEIHDTLLAYGYEKQYTTTYRFPIKIKNKKGTLSQYDKGWGDGWIIGLVMGICGVIAFIMFIVVSLAPKTINK